MENPKDHCDQLIFDLQHNNKEVLQLGNWNLLPSTTLFTMEVAREWVSEPLPQRFAGGVKGISFDTVPGIFTERKFKASTNALIERALSPGSEIQLFHITDCDAPAESLGKAWSAMKGNDRLLDFTVEQTPDYEPDHTAMKSQVVHLYVSLNVDPCINLDVLRLDYCKFGPEMDSVNDAISASSIRLSILSFKGNDMTRQQAVRTGRIAFVEKDSVQELYLDDNEEIGNVGGMQLVNLVRNNENAKFTLSIANCGIDFQGQKCIMAEVRRPDFHSPIEVWVHNEHQNVIDWANPIVGQTKYNHIQYTNWKWALEHGMGNHLSTKQWINLFVYLQGKNNAEEKIMKLLQENPRVAHIYNQWNGENGN